MRDAALCVVWILLRARFQAGAQARARLHLEIEPFLSVLVVLFLLLKTELEGAVVTICP